MPVAHENPRIRSGEVLKARLGIALERFAKVWAPPVLLVAAVLAASVWGVLDLAPQAVRSAMVATAGALAAALAILNLVRWRWPSAAEAAERIEIDFGGQPDELATGDPALWRAHLDRVEEALSRARARRAGAGIAAADPWALRYAVTLAAALGLWASGPERGVARIEQALRPASVVGDYVQLTFARARLVATDSVQLAAVAVSRWTTPAASGRALERAALQSRAQIPGNPRIFPAESNP